MFKIQQLPLVGLDSLPYNLNETNPTILIYFNPDCDHCHQQAESIRDTLHAFQGIHQVWISSNTLSHIRQFSQTYGLIGMPEVDFTKIEENKVFETFGSLSIPHIFIYNNGLLTQEFKGATSPKKLLNFSK